MNPELLTDLESCERRGFYARDFESNRMHPTEMTRRAIYSALTGDREDAGEFAGEEVMRLCSTYDLDVKDTGHLYDVGLHHAAIADIVTTWLSRTCGRKWATPAPVNKWEPKCIIHNDRLLRLALVDHITDERTLAEASSWYTVGSVAAFNLPMIIQFICLGSAKGGKRYSAWSKGVIHPRNRTIRFKPKANKIQGFKETWVQVWREEHDQISRDTWLAAMEEDGMIQELTRRVTVEPFPYDRRQEILRIIARKTEKLVQIRELPDPSFSACDWPRPCAFRRVCFAPVPVTPEQIGFWPR